MDDPLLRTRSSSWGSPEAPPLTYGGERTSNKNRARTPTRLKSHKSIGPTDNLQGTRRSVAIIGYLPDLQPLYRQSKSKSFTSLPAATLTDDSSNALLWSPSTPLLSAFRAADPREALSSWFREGSVRGSVFNLCSATLGAGALSLPFAFSKSGWCLGLLMLIVGALATVFSIHLLIRSRLATDCVSYEDLTVDIFGRAMGFIVELNILVFCFGTAIAYIIAVGDILEPVLIEVGLDRLILGLPKENDTMLAMLGDTPSSMPALAPSSSSSSSMSGSAGLTPGQEHTLRISGMIFFFSLVMFPLSLLEKINSLRFTSFFGVAAIFYLVFVTAYASITELVVHGYAETWGKAPLFVPDLFSIVEAAPIVMFAFTCQVNVFSIYDELEKQSEKRMGQVTNGAITTCFVVYLGMGLFGFWHYGKDTEGNVLKNAFPTNDPMVIASAVCIVLTIVMAFPLVVFPCRYTLDIMLRHFDGSGTHGTALTDVVGPAAEDGASSKSSEETKSEGPRMGEIHFDSLTDVESHALAATMDSSDDEKEADVRPTTSKCRHFTLTTIICAAALAVALFVSKIQIVFQLMGGTTSAFVCFILPAAFAIRLENTQRMQLSTGERIGSWCLAVGGVVVGVLSTFVTIYNLIEPNRHN